MHVHMLKSNFDNLDSVILLTFLDIFIFFYLLQHQFGRGFFKPIMIYWKVVFCVDVYGKVN